MNYNSNSIEAIEMRRCQDTLKLCGNGTLLFALWSVMKFLMELLTGARSISGFVGSFKEESRFVQIFTIIFMTILILLDIFVRIYVWKKTTLEANGRKTGNLHIVLAVLFLAVSVVSLYSDITDIISIGFDANVFMEIVIELTGDMVVVGLIYQTFKLRRLNKSFEQEG